jgi:hypothetical protein
MQSSHTFTVDSAVFDERNLVSAAGLVPVLELAEQTGLSELIAEHVQLPSTRVRSGAVNPAGKPWSMPDLSRAIDADAARPLLRAIAHDLQHRGQRRQDHLEPMPHRWRWLGPAGA